MKLLFQPLVMLFNMQSNNTKCNRSCFTLQGLILIIEDGCASWQMTLKPLEGESHDRGLRDWSVEKLSKVALFSQGRPPALYICRKQFWIQMPSLRLFSLRPSSNNFTNWVRWGDGITWAFFFRRGRYIKLTVPVHAGRDRYGLIAGVVRGHLQ